MILWIAGWYAVASVVAALLYKYDKRCARRNAWRVPEARLHLAALLGGWPGALLARRILRHKTQKPRFIAISWVIIALHVLAWGGWLWMQAS